MFGSSTKKLIIVCDEKTRDIANYLRQLISANDDKEGEVVGISDGSVETAVWTDKEYLSNSATISSNEHVLFIGKNKVSKSESKYMNIEFDMFGMKYGWLGKRAMLFVEDELLNEDRYEDFIRFSSAYELKFDKLGYKDIKLLSAPSVEKNKSLEETNNGADDNVNYNTNETENIKPAGLPVPAVKKIPIPHVNAIIPVVNGMKKGVNNFSAHVAHKKISDQQYRALTVVFYLEGLKSFLEA